MKARAPLMLLLLALAAGSAAGQTPTKSGDSKPPDTTVKEAKAPPAAVEGGGGLTVFIDPATGKIRPPEPGEMERLVPSERRPLTAPRALTNLPPGAGVGMALDSSYEMFMVVTKKPDGTLATTCVTGDKKSAEVVAASPKAAPEKAKETGDAHAH